MLLDDTAISFLGVVGKQACFIRQILCSVDGKISGLCIFARRKEKHRVTTLFSNVVDLLTNSSPGGVVSHRP